MNPKKFALIGGTVLLAVGLLSLIPSFSTVIGLVPLRVETSYGYFLNFFPMNVFNKVVHIGFGIWGILAASSRNTALPNSVWFSRAVFFVMGAFAILGMFNATNTLGGYYPLFGGEVWAHGIFAILGAYFGFTLSSRAAVINDQKFGDRRDIRNAS
jgi:hypothetical protein